MSISNNQFKHLKVGDKIKTNKGIFEIVEIYKNLVTGYQKDFEGDYGRFSYSNTVLGTPFPTNEYYTFTQKDIVEVCKEENPIYGDIDVEFRPPYTYVSYYNSTDSYVARGEAKCNTKLDRFNHKLGLSIAMARMWRDYYDKRTACWIGDTNNIVLIPNEKIIKDDLVIYEFDTNIYKVMEVDYNDKTIKLDNGSVVQFDMVSKFRKKKLIQVEPTENSECGQLGKEVDIELPYGHKLCVGDIVLVYDSDNKDFIHTGVVYKTKGRTQISGIPANLQFILGTCALNENGKVKYLQLKKVQGYTVFEDMQEQCGFKIG